MISDNFEFNTPVSKEYARMILKVIRTMDGVIKKERQAEWLNTPNDNIKNTFNEAVTPLEIMLNKPTRLEEIYLILCRIEWGISE
jgi:hypothetical protein